MEIISKAAVVPHTPEQMYRLVNDVESYPEFLPWIEKVDLKERGEDTLKATMALAIGRFRHRLTTENLMIPVQRVSLRLVEGPFKRFAGEWRFEEHGPDACRVSLNLEFEFESRILAMTFGKLFQKVSVKMVDAFCERADVCYGH